MTFSPQYLIAANLLLLALVAYSASSIVGTVIATRLAPGVRVDIAPPPEVIPNEAPKPASYYALVGNRDIFNSVKLAEPTPAPAPEAPPPDLALWGVALHERTGSSYCIIDDKKAKKQTLYRVGDVIEGTDFKVKAIEWKSVTLERGGKELALAIQEPGGPGVPGTAAAQTQPRFAAPQVTDANIRKVDENQYVINRSEVDSALENMSQLFTQIRAVPHFEGGKSIGFRLFAIRHGSLFDKIGLKNGDVLQKINSIEFNDPSRALSLMQELRNENELTVQIVRNRRSETMTYRIQ
jgi:general secretion pathway protein C